MSGPDASRRLLSGNATVEIALIVHAVCPHCQSEVRFALHLGIFTVDRPTSIWRLQCPACLGDPFYVRTFRRSLRQPLERAAAIADQHGLARTWELPLSEPLA